MFLFSITWDEICHHSFIERYWDSDSSIYCSAESNPTALIARNQRKSVVTWSNIRITRVDQSRSNDENWIEIKSQLLTLLLGYCETCPKSGLSLQLLLYPTLIEEGIILWCELCSPTHCVRILNERQEEIRQKFGQAVSKSSLCWRYTFPFCYCVQDIIF